MIVAPFCLTYARVVADGGRCVKSHPGTEKDYAWSLAGADLVTFAPSVAPGTIHARGQLCVVTAPVCDKSYRRLAPPRNDKPDMSLSVTLAIVAAAFYGVALTIIGVGILVAG